MPNAPHLNYNELPTYGAHPRSEGRSWVLMEPAAPSLSAFLGLLPPTPCNDGHGPSSQDDDRVFPYITRMLMEEDEAVVDNGALLRAQQPYAQILSDTSSAAMGAWPWPYSSTVAAAEPCYSNGIDMLAATSTEAGNNVDSTLSLLNITAMAAVEPSSFPPPSEDLAASMAFFKGMEEASKFLPNYIETVVDGTGRRKKRPGGGDEAEVEATMCRRRSKQMAASPQSESEEEFAAREELDKLMLDGYESSRADKTPQLLLAGRRRGGSGASDVVDVVDLHSMLISCAEAVSSNEDPRVVADLLQRIRSHSSPTGDGTQRVAHCFANGLEARFAGTGRELYHSLVAKRASTPGVLKSYLLAMDICSFLPLHILFSCKTICDAAAGRKKLHVVDYGLHHGLPWPAVLRRLASRDGGPPEVRLTGIDTSRAGFHPAHLIEETGRRLRRCARQFGVPFEFRGIAARPEALRAEDLGIDPDEVLVVSCLFHFRTLMDEGVVVDRPNPRDVVLAAIARMRPKVFVHAVINGSYCGAFFATRFRAALYNFTALFDMLDATVPRDSERRRLVEQGVFAENAVNIIACEGADRVERAESYRQWGARSKRAGLRQLPLDPDTVQMLRDKVKKESHKYFVINEDDGWLLHGWKGRMLYGLSTWTSHDDI